MAMIDYEKNELGRVFIFFRPFCDGLGAGSNPGFASLFYPKL
jgi:hypothetical protein